MSSYKYNIDNNMNASNSSYDFRKIFHSLDWNSNLSPEQNQELKLFIHENINRIKYYNIKNLNPQLMYFDMMKAKAGLANALITSNDTAREV